MSRITGLLRAREAALLLFTLALALALAVARPGFASQANVNAMLIGMAPDGVLAVGMTLLIVAGMFDLSVGSVLALSAVAAGLAMNHHAPVWLAIGAGLATGAACGAINGLIVTRLAVNALIATLGMMTLARSLTQVLTDGRSLSSFPSSFTAIGQGYTLNVSNSVLVMLLVMAAGDLLLRHHASLRRFYYVGSSERAAELAGVPVARVKMAGFVATGLLAAVAGILVASRLNAATPTAGVGAELRVISATVIGGAALSGGEGTILGAALGVLLLAIVSNALTQLNVSIYWQGAVNGIILILAVALDAYVRRRKRDA
ncbi:MAG: ABC transporter permease [Chthonomonadales bacterium]|nr:ABC transporter permease [Chthonomonadales bacterium]